LSVEVKIRRFWPIKLTSKLTLANGLLRTII